MTSLGTILGLILLGAGSCLAQNLAQSPLAPFTADEHTALLYHFDEGQGKVAKDSSRYGYDGEVRGAEWAPGKFGSALAFNGKDNSVYRKMTQAIEGLRQITVECWFNQENPSGRQFLIGKDVSFHFDFSEGSSTSMSLYNEGGAKPNAEGKPHQHLGAGLGTVRPGRWHHDAVTYDGRYLSFFLDGVLRQRVEAAKDFLLGVNSRGLWVGCYVGTDFWFSGKIDEVRVSDCVRYDPERKLPVGGRIFDMPEKPKPVKMVRKPEKTGLAKVEMTLKKLYGGNCAGWVYLKAPGKKAALVGQYAMNNATNGSEAKLAVDVSDEVAGDGCYLLALEPTDSSGYFALTGATLSAGDKMLAQWSGNAASRRTFQPPVLAALQVGEPAAARPARMVLLPDAVDRMWGNLELDDENPGEPTRLVGDGYAEYWLNVATPTTYRVYMRYATAALRPCDIVVDGEDLNDYNMCALNRSDRTRPRDAFWEYQGTTTLSAGPHWLRVQDVVPDIVALRLEPTNEAPTRQVPWERFAVPAGDFLARGGSWGVQALFGAPRECKLTAEGGNPPALRFTAGFHNTDMNELFGGDAVRLARRGTWDLGPFGRLRFKFEGQGSGHVVALRLVDAKGDERLLWRARDDDKATREVTVPISFEGNDVFDPGHVVEVCLDLDEGNTRADQVNLFAGAIIGPVFERRDALAVPEGYGVALSRARQMIADAARGLAQAAPLLSPGFRPWTKPVIPEEHPLYATTEPKPVTRKTLGYEYHATGARSIDPHSLDDFHKFYNFGDVCWPHIGICPQRRDYKTDEDYKRALAEMERQLIGVRDRGLYLYDIWGYVPNGEAGPTPQVAPEHDAILKRVFGDRFTGYDNGEQDGRYIGSYSDRSPAKNRREAWDDFVKWDEAICRDGMNYMNSIGSLNFSHYYGERGCRLLGLETAQGLPSDTLMFGFLRGAAKQYGRLMTQGTSIWSRFGYNMYHDRKTDGGNGYGFGPHKGCSLSLHGRLFFSGYLGDHSITGTETSQFTSDRLENGAPELSPLGKQHLDIMDWARKHPERGVQYTPVAFMLDFYNGWNMPRHLYRGDKYKIWGKFPYEKGDYLIDGMFRMVWPGYEDASYLRNERGFICPTPYGDIFDVLTNRCHPDILKQYTSIMLLGDVELTPEVVKKLTDFAQGGGDLLMDAKSAQAFGESMTGVKLGTQAKGFCSRLLTTGAIFDEQPYTYTALALSGATPLLVSEAGAPLITVNPAGKGRVIVGATDNWMTDAVKYQAPDIVNMEPPYLLLKGVRAALDQYFGSFNPVEIEPKGLTIQTCCYENDPKRLLVGLTNNELFTDWKGKLRVRGGKVASARDMRAERALGGEEAVELTVPAGDVAVVEVRVK